MFKAELDKFVCFLRDHMLDSYSMWDPLDNKYDNGVYRRNGIHVVLDLAMYDDDRDNSKRALAHFVLGGNTNVFAYLQDFGDHDPLDYKKFENISNHDSCWRGGHSQLPS